MVLNEKGDKKKIDEIKKIINKEYSVYNVFIGYNFLTFETNEEIENVKNKISKYGKVERIYNNYKALDTEELWNLKKIESVKANTEMGLTGKNVVVAVIDLGIDTTNEDLKNNLIKNFECYYDEYKDPNFLNYANICKEEIPEVSVDNKHGTHVAGTIASENYGVAKNVEIINFAVKDRLAGNNSLKVDARALMSSYENILNLIDNGEKIDIVNMSYGFSNILSATEETILNNIYNKGTLLVAASGNPCEYVKEIPNEENDFKEECSTKLFGIEYAIDPYKVIKHYPSDFENVISVGAIDNDDKRSSWSILTETTSGASENLDIVAPGNSILSTVTDNKTELMGGTSMASPHIAGILALYKENYPTFNSKEIENMLYEQTENLGDDSVWDRVFGYGKATAIPPKHFQINKEISLFGEYEKLNFANDTISPSTTINLSGEYKATRAKGWDDNKKRFEYYFITLNTESSQEIGWIKADDTFNNIDSDREKLIFTGETIGIFDSANITSYIETIDINPKRIREHVSEEKKIEPETGYVEWYKINLPEYSIENKWIYVPTEHSGNPNVAPSLYKEINFETIIENSELIFYDDPQLMNNKFTNNQVNNKRVIINKGYEWVDSKTGYRWYRVSIPELNIENKWVNIGDNLWGNIQQYGLMDNVSGRITDELNVYDFESLTGNFGFHKYIYSGGHGIYHFEQPINIESILIGKYPDTSVEGSQLKLEFFDQDDNPIGEYLFDNTTDYSEKHLILKEKINNVYSYKLSNVGSKEVILKTFEIFGSFNSAALPAKKIDFEQKLQNQSYTLYDFPKVSSSKVVLNNTLNKNAIISEGYYWIDSKKGYRWYKISIPELGVENKWINVGDTIWGNIQQYGLMDKVSGRIVDENKVYGFDVLTGNWGYDKAIYPGDVETDEEGQGTYRFEQPVTVERIFVDKYYKKAENGMKLKIEFFDKNGIFIDHYTFNQNSLFEKHINLEQKIEGVLSYKLSNIGTETILLRYFDIFGEYSETAFPPQKISFEQTLENQSYTVYDEPSEKSLKTIVNNTLNKKAVISEGYYWIDSKRGYRWYKISIPELGIENKWVSVEDRIWGDIQQYGLMDNVSGKIYDEYKVYNLEALTGNWGYDKAIYSGGYGTYRFEQPVTVERIFIDKYYKKAENGTQLKIEFFGLNGNSLEEYVFTENDLFKKYFTLPQKLDNVYSYKISNIGTEQMILRHFDIFGEFNSTALPAQKISFEQNLENQSYILYDAPSKTSSSVILNNTLNKKAVISEGYYWIDSKKGYRWYKISIPDLGVENKWVIVEDRIWGDIHKYGLMDTVSGSITEETNVYNFVALTGNTGYDKHLYVGGSATYMFNQNVNVSKIFIDKYYKTLENKPQLNIEFFDENHNSLGLYPFDYENDFFKTFFDLPNMINNVRYYKLSNTGTETIILRYFDIF